MTRPLNKPDSETLKLTSDPAEQIALETEANLLPGASPVA